MAFPKSNRQYALITDAATGTADTPGGLGAILTQVDQEGNFHAISFASRQLDHEVNYSPFLLEAAAAVWGMDFFNEYLKGKRFILYTDRKPLEKLGHLHSKMLNRLQTALLEHDFVIQYKKGSNMPAEYLSRLPGAKENIASISAFDPFQADLYELQMTDETLQAIQTFRDTKQWPQTIPRQDQAYYTAMIDKLFQDKNKVVWVRLNDFSYPRTALYLPTRYRKEAMCEAHDSILGGHNAAHKTYLKISTSYFTKTFAYDASREKNRLTKELHWRHSQFRNIQTSGFMQIFLAQCSQRTVIKNLFSALLTPLQSTLWSLRLPTRRLKRWQTPSTEIGLQNLGFRHRYTQTEAKNSSTNFQPNFSNC